MIVLVVSNFIVVTTPQLGGIKCAVIQRMVENVPTVPLCGHSVSQQTFVVPLSASTIFSLPSPLFYNHLFVSVFPH